MNDAVQMNDKLTGNYCFATNVWGSLVLWVEIIYEAGDTGSTWTTWRKARVYDLPKLNIKL